MDSGVLFVLAVIGALVAIACGIWAWRKQSPIDRIFALVLFLIALLNAFFGLVWAINLGWV